MYGHWLEPSVQRGMHGEGHILERAQPTSRFPPTSNWRLIYVVITGGGSQGGSGCGLGGTEGSGKGLGGSLLLIYSIYSIKPRPQINVTLK